MAVADIRRCRPRRSLRCGLADSALTAAQVAVLGTNDLAVLGTTQIAALTSTQVLALGTTGIAALSTPAQVDAGRRNAAVLSTLQLR